MIKIMKYSEVKNDEIFARVAPSVNVTDIVAEIIENVKASGDKALFEYCKKFDKAELTSLLVTEEEIDVDKDVAHYGGHPPTEIGPVNEFGFVVESLQCSVLHQILRFFLIKRQLQRERHQ